ncbi:hypothetical protein Hamer_G018006 [Homarus americanus]|uniref:ISXO2-like transposase domain-containing protein n=1 Tax=Homarus americanus TaxID=6706 RepID=A0A8J5TB08_HOMAM|nr:hypothetical protein Hamer_G018006 [Homarus americanus]
MVKWVHVMYLWSEPNHHRGRAPHSPIWVFGIGDTSRSPSVGYMEIVETRDAATLLPIILKVVQQGSVIHSDEWRAYRNIQGLGYTHRTVNHSVNFVDVNTGVHAQTIESYWNKNKSYIKTMRGCKRSFLNSYLQEFIDRGVSEEKRQSSSVSEKKQKRTLDEEYRPLFLCVSVVGLHPLKKDAGGGAYHVSVRGVICAVVMTLLCLVCVSGMVAENIATSLPYWFIVITTPVGCGYAFCIFAYFQTGWNTHTMKTYMESLRSLPVKKGYPQWTMVMTSVVYPIIHAVLTAILVPEWKLALPSLFVSTSVPALLDVYMGSFIWVLTRALEDLGREVQTRASWRPADVLSVSSQWMMISKMLVTHNKDEGLVRGVRKAVYRTPPASSQQHALSALATRLEARPGRVEVWGMDSLSSSTFVSLCGLVLTYLLVLIQFCPKNNIDWVADNTSTLFQRLNTCFEASDGGGDDTHSWDDMRGDLLNNGSFFLSFFV